MCVCVCVCVSRSEYNLGEPVLSFHVNSRVRIQVPGIGRSYLYTLFQNSMGMSPQQFLTTFRITKATELLQLTDLPIESIALSCGYRDPLVFAKAFRQMKKMSPSGYRKEMQKGGSRRNQEYLRQVEEFISQINKITF